MRQLKNNVDKKTIKIYVFAALDWVGCVSMRRDIYKKLTKIYSELKKSSTSFKYLCLVC